MRLKDAMRAITEAPLLKKKAAKKKKEAKE